MDGLSSIDSLPRDEVRPPPRIARGTQPRHMLETLVEETPTGEAFGPYVVHEKLGAGGMATVHRAEQRGIAGFSKPVALKRLADNLAHDPAFVQSFAHEAHLVSRLRHDHIAQAYDFGKVGDTYYIAMELVPGPTLQQLMHRARATGVAIPIPIIIEILIQLCDALDHAHNLCDDAGVPLGIIHRDVSPSNVIVANAGMVKLIDFGIAKITSSVQRTSAGVIKGKFGYIAPEYTRGQLDARADLFALGVIAHELLTGQRLFRGDSDFATLIAVRERIIPPPSRHNPGVSSDLDDIVMTALQRDPGQRWQTAGAMRNALATAARSLGVAVGGQSIREWVDRAGNLPPVTEEPNVETMSASLDVSEPSMIMEMLGTEATASLRAPAVHHDSFTTPETFQVRGKQPKAPRSKAAPVIAFVAFAAVAVAAWQAWSVIVVWSAGG